MFGTPAIGEDGILAIDPVGQFGAVRAPTLCTALERGDGDTEGVCLAVLVTASEEKSWAISDAEFANKMKIGLRGRIAGAGREPEIGRAGRLSVLLASLVNGKTAKPVIRTAPGGECRDG